MTKRQERVAVALFLVAGIASAIATLIDLVRGTSANWLALGAGVFCVAMAFGIHGRGKESSSGKAE